MANNHAKCRKGKCQHGHVDFCPKQKRPTPTMQLVIDRLNGGNDLGMISEAVMAGGKYKGQRYIFEARSTEGEGVLLKAVSVMFKHYSPEDIAHFISEVRNGKVQ